ncbi:MAG: two-component regulator propeller domain-containing protein [Ferruginibacter sp.]
MMKILLSFLCGILFLLFSNGAKAQEKTFKKVVSGASISGQIRGITQDHQGYIWFGVGTPSGGLSRYDGSDIITYRHDPKNSNSLSNNYILSICTDSAGYIWIGTSGGGLDRFDPENKSFKHFRHEPKDPSSISSDSVSSLLEDHAGNLWMATNGGISLLDRSAGKFKNYIHDPNDPASLTKSSFIYSIYEDKEQNIWLATIGGGLDRFDRKSGKFMHYKHDRNNPTSISSDSVTLVYEDSRGNFWVSTGSKLEAGTIFQSLDRKTGVFTDFTNAKDHPGMPAPPPLEKGNLNYITFIHEDAKGGLWIGTNVQGINRYDPATKTNTHYGVLYNSITNRDPVYDTLSGYSEAGTSPRLCYQSKDGLLWLGISSGSLYQVNPFNPTVPYHPIKTIAVNSFYKDDKGGLWLALQEGLLYKPLNGPEKKFVSDRKNPNSLTQNIVNWIVPDPNGNLLLATYGGGVNVFNPVTGTFKSFRHSQSDSNTLSCDFTSSLYLDNEKNLWVGSDTGLNKLNLTTGMVTRYLHNPKDSNTISNNTVYVEAGENENIWAGTVSGLNKLNKKTGKWQEYLPSLRIQAIFYDSKNILWAGTNHGLYQYSQVKDNFIAYSYQEAAIDLGSVMNIIEDQQHNLWVTSSTNIYKINPGRDSMRVYGSESGFHSNDLLLVDNLVTKDGELIFGDGYGYYTFYPETLNTKWIAPDLYISSFQMGNKEITPGKGMPIEVPMYLAKEVRLNYNQNSFSFEFTALHYAIPGDVKYLYKLEGYDSSWQNLGSKNKAYFFNVPPGKYVLHVKAVASNGAVADKSIDVIISQPWYFTWWGITLQLLGLILLVSIVSYIRSRQLRRQNKVLEEKVNHRTKQLKESLDSLKSTQSQLIQSVKMASLGELTAGIAHEIQNPLNFVNNFSEVNKEMLTELIDEMEKGNYGQAKLLANEVIGNEEKINHHGKRADAIVKGMLQHSQKSTGTSQPTNFNNLANEYLRLSYHGLRAKDKNFNAELKTDFDNSIGKINIIPQEIGRVLLNLYNNAFYACAERSRSTENANLTADNSQLPANYQPTVSVTTKKTDDRVLITVSDNGNGIPKNIIDKIFQPFFTTKPSGQGTGLGLSLSYDIIKAHGGEIKVESTGDKGTEFVIQLPI